MELWGPYKWPYKWLTVLITLVIGVINPVITGRGPTLNKRSSIIPGVVFFGDVWYTEKLVHLKLSWKGTGEISTKSNMFFASSHLFYGIKNIEVAILGTTCGNKHDIGKTTMKQDM